MAWTDPDDDDLDDADEDDDPTVPCPHCRAAVYEDAERCPACGWYLSDEDAPPARPPLWIALGALAALAGLLFWVLNL